MSRDNEIIKVATQKPFTLLLLLLTASCSSAPSSESPPSDGPRIFYDDHAQRPDRYRDRDTAFTSVPDRAVGDGAVHDKPVLPEAKPACTLAWRPMTSGTLQQLQGVWAVDAKNVFVVGRSGTILHFDGLAWSPQSSGTTEELDGVWASSSTDVFAVGGPVKGKGVILHFDGASWSPMVSTSDTALWATWGSGPSNVFAVGKLGRIVHYDGAQWKPMLSGVDPVDHDSDFQAIWGLGPNYVMTVSTLWPHFLLYDGSQWSEPHKSSFGWGNLAAVWASGKTDIYAGGFSTSSPLCHFDGTTWSKIPNVYLSVSGLWGSGPADVFAVGKYGEVWHRDATSWAPMNSGTSQWLFAVNGTGPTNVFAVGEKGTIIRYSCE